MDTLEHVLKYIYILRIALCQITKPGSNLNRQVYETDGINSSIKWNTLQL